MKAGFSSMTRDMAGVRRGGRGGTGSSRGGSGGGGGGVRAALGSSPI